METKKISFDTLERFMSPKEMKNVLGGSGGSCAAIGSYDAGAQQCYCNISQKEAEFWGSCDGCHWCCDSCGSASWYEGCCS